MADKDDPVSLRECQAYREAIKTEIKSIKNAIYLGLSISTAVITIVIYLLQLFM